MATLGQIGTGVVLAASLTFSGLVFTGTTDINDIKNLGAKWKQDITDVVNNTIGMKSNADALKQDAIAKINAKTEKINQLNALIQDLYNQIGTGSGNLEDAQNEINRLESELTKANEEIASLKAQFDVLDTEIQTVKSTTKTASDVDTTVSGTIEETDTPTGPNTTPTEPTAPVNDYTAEEDAIKSAFLVSFPTLTDMVVTMTDTQVVVTSNEPQFTYLSASQMTDIINSAIAPKTVSHADGQGSNTNTFNINQ